MHADLTKVRQILFNLLSNACKFTEHGTVSLETERMTQDGADWLVFRIADSGIGMTPEQMSKLFQPFTQADAATMRKYGGTGLGLALCQRFSEMMGGEVTVASEPGHGSQFTVRLPAKVRDPAADAAPDSTQTADLPLEEAPPDALRILVIDDDPAARDLLVRSLTRERFHVWTATSAQEGVRLARELRPDAITLDVVMPGADGWSALTALKADASTAAIPVIMVTITQDKGLSYALGATDFLTKPIDRERLAAVLRHILDKADSPTVLLVGNDQEAREVLVRAIERERWTVEEADSGAEALERVTAHRPDLILLDLMMPDGDGAAFVHALRGKPAWQSIPVVVVSTMDLSSAEREGLAGSVEAILPRGGLELDVLMAEIRRLVRAPALHT
jgi:CheY-like chemotaxis protein